LRGSGPKKGTLNPGSPQRAPAPEASLRKSQVALFTRALVRRVPNGDAYAPRHPVYGKYGKISGKGVISWKP
jgi:hypothetical protein